MCATHSPSVQAKACRLDNLARAKLAKDCVLRARTLRLKSRNWQRMAPCSHQRNCQQRQWLHLLHLGSTALPSSKQWLHDMQRKSRHCCRNTFQHANVWGTSHGLLQSHPPPLQGAVLALGSAGGTGGTGTGDTRGTRLSGRARKPKST